MAGGEKDEYGGVPSWNIVVICTVGGVLFFEYLCHHMNHAAKGKKHATELLDGLYKELAILGVVAFVLWSINVSPYSNIDYDDKHLFEAIHMTLFLAALFHSFFVGLVTLYSRQIARRWDIFEDDEMRRYKDLKQQHRRTAQLLGIRHSSLKRGVGYWRSTWLYLRHPILSRRLWELSEHVSYHALRSQFIRDNQLPRNFRFAAYLKKCEQDVVIDLAEIKHCVWAAFILAVGLELYVKGIIGEAESNKDVKGLFLFASALVMACALAVHFKLKSAYNTLVHSYTTSTDRREGIMQYFGGDVTSSVSQLDLFWFGKPDLMLLALQSMQFLLAVMVGALIWFGTGDSTGLVIVAEILLSVGALLIYIIVLPKFIPKYTKVTHVGDMVNRHILSETLKKQKKNFKRRALPPTIRQVSVMARMKASETAQNDRLLWLRKIMAGHGFRELVMVLVSVHFFVVAYNTDPIQKGEGTEIAWIAEMVLAAMGLFVEVATHIVVWRGKAFFHCNPFLSSEDATTLAANKAAAAVIYPSVSRRNLLDEEAGDEEAAKPADATKAAGKVLSPSNKGAAPPADVYSPPTRCSIWACFGWTGLGGGGGCCGGVPPQAAVGAWRTLDLALVLAVVAFAITTKFLGGTAREVVHALQGLVILRIWPLYKCPLTPAAGHDDLHDVDGATVHHDPLDNASREGVMEETLRLLRGQTAPEGTFASRALTAQSVGPGEEDDALGMDDMKPTLTKDVALTQMHATIEEEKDDDLDGDDEDDTEVANVGVAMALREACAAHPELVQSHGPLSAPILRAMLGLDPHKTSTQDTNQAIAVAARAVAMARGLNRSDVAERAASNATVDPAAGGRLRRQSSAAGPPPSAADLSSSSSSSEMSSDDDGGASRNDRNNSGVRGRLSSFLGGAHRQQQREQQQALYQQQQEIQYQIQMQQRQQHLQQFQYQQYQQRQQQEAMLGQGEGGGNAFIGRSASSFNAPPAAFGGAPPVNMPPQEQPWLFDSSASMDGSAIGPLYSDMGGGFSGSSANTSAAAWHAGQMHRAGHQGWAGTIAVPPTGFNGPSYEPPASSVGSRAASAKSAKHRSKPRGRSSSKRRSLNAKADGGVMAAAVEDMERPVLPSFASSTGSQVGPGGVPYHSGHGVPFSSGHRGAMSRGTPARTRRNYGRTLTGNDSAAEADATASGRRGGGRGGDVEESDATFSASSASAIAGSTPAANDRDSHAFTKRE